LADYSKNLFHWQKPRNKSSKKDDLNTGRILRLHCDARNGASPNAFVTGPSRLGGSVDELLFGGMEKHRILTILRQHVFDDQISHSSRRPVTFPLVHIPRSLSELEYR